MFEKQIEIGYLLDFYSELLSERKRTVLDMYYNEDMSLSEISEQTGISRQGAHALIKKAGEELLELESKLHVAEKFRTIDALAVRAQEAISRKSDDGDASEVAMIINEIRKSIESN